MGRQREPIGLVIAKGKKHLTKSEIEQRRAAEVAPITDGIAAPKYLTVKQRRRFDELAAQLTAIEIMGETDCDTLARYVVAQDLYEQTVREQRKHEKERPTDPEAEGFYEQLELWYTTRAALDRRQERYLKQASALARDLALTIGTRCRLQVPSTEKPEKPVNKFDLLSGGGGGRR